MSARRIARELAVILLPQLPKDKDRFEKLEIEKLASKAVLMLTDYAKQCLSDANGFINESRKLLADEEMHHPDNEQVVTVADLKSVRVTTGQLGQHLDNLERALNLTSEALDIPQLAIESKDAAFLYTLISTYAAHRPEIDQFIGRVKTKWRVERMVSIDRDI
jgi:transcription termination factor NusB